MGTSGVESLSLDNDHTMKGTGRLKFSEDNGYFMCVMQFSTSLDGTWEYDGKDLLLHFDPASFIFRVDAGSPSITMSGKGGILKNLKR